MAEFTARVAGTQSLPNIESAIRFEEGKSTEFLTSKVENNKDNLANFKRLDPGTFPKDLKLTLDTDPVPDGYVPFPNNPIAMIVGGSAKNVKAWRKQ